MAMSYSSVTADSTDPSSSNAVELKSKPDTGNLEESSGIDSEFKSVGIESGTENEKPPLTGKDNN